MTRLNPYRSAATKIAVGALAAAVLVFAPSAAFAQRGGGGGHMGGGGGGGHFGGGGGVGSASHASTPSHSAPRPATHSAPVAQSRPPVAAPVRTGSTPAAGTTNAVVAHPSLFGVPATSGPDAGLVLHNQSAAPRTTVIGFPPSESHTWESAPSHSGPMSFSGQGHEIWQDSPSRGSDNVVVNAPATANRSLFSTSTAPSTIIRPMPHMGFQPRPVPIIFLPVYGFYGPYGYFGGAFGCDPFFGSGFNSGFGCNGFGYGFGYGGGFGYGAYYGSGYGYGSGPGYDDSSTTVNASPDEGYGPYSSTNLSSDNSSPSANGDSSSNDAKAPAAVTAAPATTPAASPATTIWLKDGTSYEVMSYWLDAGKLHYITNYGGETSIDMSQLDLQRTVDENAIRGANFTLRPAPATPTAPAPAPDATPAPQQ